MYSLDLLGNDFPHPEAIKSLKPAELFYLRIAGLKEIPDSELKLIFKATQMTSEVILSIPCEDYALEEQRLKLFELGVKGFALRVTHNTQKWLKHQGFGQFYAGDRDIINQYHSYVHSVPAGKELAVEFQLGPDLRVLGPTITGLYELGAKFIILNIEGSPNPEACYKLRDVFDYLKIRSCNYLNVYFPFWSEHSAEWNVKTQNTFSGLEEVHIDISNRCSHSCVFCGLYGPEAIEDFKQRSGGVLSEAMKNHMRMEIDPDKCLEIIQSLPWTVRHLQFGGFGDPLMHDHAVEFMAAARKRGFSVEVLSNMEYLDDDDVEALHKLGGKNINDLHFFANVSGGTSETFIKTRPKQTEKSFQKITHNLTLFSNLRNENKGKGVHFTLMCVVNKLNCHELLDVAKLAHELGASRLWFKPMELHSEATRCFIPSNDLMKGMANSLSEAINFAQENNIEMFQMDVCTEIIRSYLGETINV